MDQCGDAADETGFSNRDSKVEESESFQGEGEIDCLYNNI